ncbi:MAG: formylmethanofuran dehydrogenase subunit B [Promethearchaeota archaeon]
MTEVRDVVCPFCGCLCDDIVVKVENNQIKETENSCRISFEKFMGAQKHRIESPMIRKNGKLESVDYEEAYSHAAKILKNSKRSLWYGWSTVPVEAIKKGIENVEKIRGVIDNTTCVCHGPTVLAYHNVGISTSTLGEIKNRSDLLVYIGANPLNAHPRHLSRYALYTRGYFRQKGRKERRFIVVDVRKTDTAEIADLFIKIKPNMDYEFLSVIRARLAGHNVSGEATTGVPDSVVDQFIELCKSSRFITFFFGVGLTMSGAKHRNIDAAISLVRDLNAITKAVIMPLRGHFNVAGFNRVSNWQTGFPFAIDFHRGYPRYYPGENSSVDVLRNKDTDAVVIVGSDVVSHFPLSSVKHLQDVPVILFTPHWTPSVEVADIVFPTTMAGIEEEGTAYRMDGVPLPMKKVVEPPDDIYSDTYLLSELLSRIIKD